MIKRLTAEKRKNDNSSNADNANDKEFELIAKTGGVTKSYGLFKTRAEATNMEGIVRIRHGNEGIECFIKERAVKDENEKKINSSR